LNTIYYKNIHTDRRKNWLWDFTVIGVGLLTNRTCATLDNLKEQKHTIKCNQYKKQVI